MQPDSGPVAPTNSYDVSLVHLSKTFGAAPALSDLTLNVDRGSFFSLLGPSGCGKTTTLRLIAGFEQPTEGQILIRGQDVADLPPYRRDVNTVFQSYALFPHMSVADNIAYGLRQRGVARSHIRRRVDEALAMVRLPGAGARRPAQLSGGQQQRVALARALVNRPTVLLLDEPLSALDLKLRKEMQVELKALQQQVGITFIYVTHDQEEAITLSDRIAVMNRGRLEQEGTPTEIYERPQTRFVADFIGLTNFITGRIRQISGVGSSCVLDVTTEIGDLTCSGLQPPVSIGDTVTITLRPEKVRLAEPQTAAPPGWNATQGTITQATFLGPQNEYRIQVAGAPGAVHTAITVRQQNVGDITSAMPAEGGSRESLGDWRVFGPGERVTLLWRHDVSLVLRDAGSSAQTVQGVGAQAPASHASLV